MFKKLFFATLFVIFSTTPARAIDGFVTITSPSGGTFTEGDTMHITWNSSSNIDKINIGYNTDPHHGGWVIFTMPNTGSYDWNVNVGNTTNTQFYLTITGYETGQGSVSSTSTTFTVNQNPPLSTTPSSPPTPTPTSNQTTSPTPPSSDRWSGIVYPSNYPTPRPTPLTPRLTVYTLILYQEFYFEGSRTTDLKSIADPRHVDNFTLDTASGFLFIFEETIDLTDSKMLAGLQNADDYWTWDAWFVWIEWEWWIKYDVTETITVEYENDALTAYAPALDTTSSSPTPAPKKSASPRPTPQVLGSEAGKIKLAVNDGTPVKITPRVTLDTPASPTYVDSLELTGHTSHTNLAWTLSHNGTKQTVTPTINSDTGEFSLTVPNLTVGYNTFALTYQLEGNDPVALEPVSTLYTRSFWELYGRYIWLTLAFLIVFAAGFFAPRAPKLIKKLQKKLRRFYHPPQR